MAETEMVIDEIKRLVTEWGLSVEKEDAVRKKLQEMGVEHQPDLEYLNPEVDLAEVLPPIQARRISAIIKKMFTAGIQSNLVLNSTMELGASAGPSEWSDLDTSAQSSPSTTSSESMLSPSQNWTASFNIPYHKFPPDLIESCEKGERPKTHLRLEMIRILCSDIKVYTRLPGKRNITIIANKLAAKYPKSFNDIVENEVLGTGVASLVAKIMDRMTNAYGRGSDSKRSLDGTEKEKNQAKLCMADSYGCVNYNPTSYPKDMSHEQLNEIKNYLYQESLKEERDKSKVKDLMKKTYVLQRWAINEKDPVPSIQSLKDDWPLLFECDYLMDHFETLTGVHLQKKIVTGLAEKHVRLLHFIREKRSKTKGVKDCLEEIVKAGENTFLTDALIIRLVAVCFSEDPDLLVKVYEETINSKDVERVTKILTPHVAVIGNLTDQNAQLFIVMEKKVVTQNIDSLLTGITMVFAAYYVFNLQYEEGLSATLEFIQRCLVNLNPSSGSKSKSRKTLLNKKVLSFLNTINDFDWNM